MTTRGTPDKVEYSASKGAVAIAADPLFVSSTYLTLSTAVTGRVAGVLDARGSASCGVCCFPFQIPRWPTAKLLIVSPQ